MSASRINLPMDRATTDLIAVTKAVMLAGDRALPKSTGKSAWDLARAIRAAFEGGADDMALVLVSELRALVGQEVVTLSPFISPIVKRLDYLEERYAAQARIEGREQTPLLEPAMAASA